MDKKFTYMRKASKGRRMKEEADGVIRRKIGRWSVYDYTGVVYPDVLKFMKNTALVPKTENNSFLLDIESWYSITPADLADNISKSIRNMHGGPVDILDLFSGVGGNTFSFLKYGNYVDSVEFDYRKIKCLRSNIRECGGSEKHRIFYSDVYAPSLLHTLKEKYDVIMASPPWGGLCYKKESGFDLFVKCRVLELESIYRKRAPVRIYMIPRQIPDIVLCQIEDQFVVYEGTSLNSEKVVAKIVAVGNVDGFKLDNNHIEESK